VVDVVPAARTVLVVVDPAVTSLAALAQALSATAPRTGRREHGELVEVPVVYDGEDLAEAAALLGWDAPELVDRHTSAQWSVAFCGFAPGFGYLASPDWTVEAPRRSSPRTKVPPGSVALAGEFSGVYPRESPGGWQLIGRTRLAVFDLSREPAALLRPGSPGPLRRGGRVSRALEVLSPGPLTTVQDEGRPGQAALGIGPLGGLRPPGVRPRNRLVGNPPAPRPWRSPSAGSRSARAGTCCWRPPGARCSGPWPHVAPTRLRDGEVLRLGQR
jgi:KipI family sensor histidine kinase inhibitor